MNDQIDDYIFFNLEHLKEKIKGIKNQRDSALISDPIFSDIILDQYKDRVRGEVALEICFSLGCSFEEAMVRLEEVKVETLLE